MWAADLSSRTNIPKNRLLVDLARHAVKNRPDVELNDILEIQSKIVNLRIGERLLTQMCLSVAAEEHNIEKIERIRDSQKSVKFKAAAEVQFAANQALINKLDAAIEEGAPADSNEWTVLVERLSGDDRDYISSKGKVNWDKYEKVKGR